MSKSNFITIMLLGKHIIDDCTCAGCAEYRHDVVFTVSKRINDMLGSKIVTASLTLPEILNALDPP